MSEVMLVDTKDFEKLQTVSKNLEKMVMEALSSVSTVDTLQEMPEFITDIKHKNREDENRTMGLLEKCICISRIIKDDQWSTFFQNKLHED